MTMNKLEPIYHYLYQLQISPACKGFYQLAYALYLIQTDSEYLTAVTKRLYPDVARYYHTSAAAIEQNIRRMVALIWLNTPAAFEYPDGRMVHRRPTSAQALAMLAVRISSYTLAN